MQKSTMKLQLCVVVFINVVNCEWVEITPIQNKKFLSDPKRVFQTTTMNYESIMKTPLIKTETGTTSTHLPDQANLASDIENDTLEITVDTEMPDDESINLDDDSMEREQHDGLKIEEFLPFIKRIQNNLLSFKKSHTSKLSVLKKLRDDLVDNIKGLVPTLWKPKVSFEARGYDDEDTHMDFPSNEGALMTIGFLTFAVFLIKLVIKLIHTLKNKQQLNSTTTTAASVVFLKRKKRDDREEEIAKILQSIEEFQKP